MTPEQYKTMERLSAGVGLSVQREGLDLQRAIFPDQVEVNFDVYNSLVRAGWVTVSEQSETCDLVVATAHGKAAFHIEQKYINTRPDEAVNKLQNDMLYILLRCQKEVPERGKFPINEHDSGAVLADYILQMIDPLPEKPERQQSDGMTAFPLPDVDICDDKTKD